jgi:hypothetical protein
MQYKSIAVLLAVVYCAYAADDAAVSKKGCAGGFQEGSQVDRGRYWYTCQDGQLAPKGCFADDKTRLNLHETFKSGGYILECVIDASGFLSFRYKGCVSEQGKELAPGDSWEDDKYWYSCSTEGDHLRMDIGGCTDEGKRYNIGETKEKGEFFYECRRWANNTCSMCPVACKNEGKRVNVGDSFEKNTFWYMCTKDDGRLAIKCIGCIHADQRLKDGDRYVNEDSVYECAIRKDTEPSHRLVGCHDTDNGATIERRLGCQWTKGSPPNQYVMKCDSKDNEKTAYKTTVRCFYGSREAGGYEIEPGCYKIVDKDIVACRNADSGPVIETFPVDQLQQAYAKGVKFCN